MRICERERLSPLHRIDLYLRWATLRNRQQRFGQALRFIDEATVISEAESDENWLAVALATRGVTYGAAGRLREAVATLSKVLANRRLTPQVELSATTNLARAILELDDPERLDEALIHLRNARRLLGPRQSVQKSRLYWIEGTACIRRGRTDDGERRYRKALAGFRKFCAVYEHALVALDISALLRFAGRWSELEGLAAETFARFQDMSEDAEALAALRLWLEASRERELNEALLSNVKATLEQRSRCNTPSGVARRLGS
ncbi:MAG: tetratricopeptide repeat protein [bacterium]|nr:tetratricopeptide repeat protein [bacterium]